MDMYFDDDSDDDDHDYVDDKNDDDDDDDNDVYTFWKKQQPSRYQWLFCVAVPMYECIIIIHLGLFVLNHFHISINLSFSWAAVGPMVVRTTIHRGLFID